MANSYFKGRLTAPAGGVTKGLAYLIGSLLVVARSNAAEGAYFTAALGGTWTLAKTSAQAWTEGQKLYWNASTSKVDSDGTTGILIGTAAAVADNPSSTGRVRLNGVAAATSEGPQGAITLTALDLDNEISASADAQRDVVAITAAAGACAGDTSPSAANVDTAIATATAQVCTLAQANDATIAVQVDALIVDVAAIRTALIAAGIIAAA